MNMTTTETTRQTVLLLDMGRGFRGGQRQVLYLARALAASADFSPLLLCVDGPLARAAQNEDLCVHILPPRIWRPDYWMQIWSVCKRAVKSGPVILHTHDAHAATAGAILKTLLPSLRLIHSRRVSYPLHSGIRTWKYRRADAVTGVSAAITRSLAMSGLDPARLHTIHSGIDPDTYASRAAEQANSPFLFLAIGALTPQKGFEVLLEAAAKLNAIHDLPPWRLRLVGNGPLRDPLNIRRARLGLEERVDMPGRQESRDELPHAHALVVPSVDGEGSSGTIKEGWVTGLPVLASDLPSNGELITPEYSGLLFISGDADSLARAMIRLLTDAPLCARLVQGGTATLHRFTAACMAQNTMNLYRELV